MAHPISQSMGVNPPSPSTLDITVGTFLTIKIRYQLKEAEKWKKRIQNLDAKKAALLWLKNHNFSEI